MKDSDFLNQKTGEMSIMELADAIRIKARQATKPEPKPEPLRIFTGKTIHPNFTETDESVYYLKEEMDAKLKEYFEETSYKKFVGWDKKYHFDVDNYIEFCKEKAKQIFGKELIS